MYLLLIAEIPIYPNPQSLFASHSSLITMSINFRTFVPTFDLDLNLDLNS